MKSVVIRAIVGAVVLSALVGAVPVATANSADPKREKETTSTSPPPSSDDKMSDSVAKAKPTPSPTPTSPPTTAPDDTKSGSVDNGNPTPSPPPTSPPTAAPDDKKSGSVDKAEPPGKWGLAKAEESCDETCLRLSEYQTLVCDVGMLETVDSLEAMSAKLLKATTTTYHRLQLHCAEDSSETAYGNGGAPGIRYVMDACEQQCFWVTGRTPDCAEIFPPDFQQLCYCAQKSEKAAEKAFATGKKVKDGHFHRNELMLSEFFDGGNVGTVAGSESGSGLSTSATPTSTTTTTTTAAVCAVKLTVDAYNAGQKDATCIESKAFVGETLNIDLSEFRSLVRIEEHAFDGLTGNVTIVDANSPLVDIGKWAFAAINGKLTIDIQAPKLARIGDEAFYSDSLFLAAGSSIKLRRLGALRSVGIQAFAHFKHSLDIASAAPSLDTIGDEAFEGAGIGNVELTNLAALRKIGYQAFKSSAVQVKLLGMDVLPRIGAGAFEDHRGARHLSGGRALDFIGKGAFLTSSDASKGNVIDFELRAMKHLSPDTFNGYQGTLTLSNLASLVSIENETFVALSGELHISGNTNKLEYIGDKAFGGLGSYNNVRSTISFNGLDSLERVGTDAFGGCAGAPFAGTVNITGDPGGGLQEGRPRTMIAECAFASLSNTSVVTLTGLSKLGSIYTKAFFQSRAKITISGYANTLKLLGARAFATCTTCPMGSSMPGCGIDECQGDPNLVLALLKLKHTMVDDDNAAEASTVTIVDRALLESHAASTEIRYALDLVAIGDPIVDETNPNQNSSYKTCPNELWAVNPNTRNVLSCRIDAPDDNEYYDVHSAPVKATRPMIYNGNYKISPLMIDNDRTVVGPGGGTVGDLTFQIGNGRPSFLFGAEAPDWLFLNPNTGVVMVEIKETTALNYNLNSAEPLQVGFELLVADKVGTTAVLELYFLDFKPVPELAINVGTTRALHGGTAVNTANTLYTDPDHRKSGYYTFSRHETYKLLPKIILDSSNYTQGGAGDLMFSKNEALPLQGGTDVTDAWYINPKTGEMLAQFYPWNDSVRNDANHSYRTYTVELWATDMGGARAIVETMTFPVTYWDVDIAELYPRLPDPHAQEKTCGDLGADCHQITTGAECGDGCEKIDGCAFCNQDSRGDPTNCLVCKAGWELVDGGYTDCTGTCRVYVATAAVGSSCQHQGEATEQGQDCTHECEVCKLNGDCELKQTGTAADMYKHCATCWPKDDPRRYDRVAANAQLGLQCNCDDEWTGSNCQTNVKEAEEELKRLADEFKESKTKSKKQTATFAGSGVGALVVILVAAYAATKYRDHRELNKPADYKKMLQMLIDSGELSVEQLGHGTDRDTEAGGDGDVAAAAGFPREIRRSHITNIHKLGNGAFGEVWKCLLDESADSGEKLVAVKECLEAGGEGEEDLLKESMIMAQVPAHVNVVEMIGVVTRGTPLLLVVALCEEGSVLGFVQSRKEATPDMRLTVADKLTMCSDVAHGMAHLAACHFVHRDLAARNVLIDANFVCKIADFGLSRAVAASDDNDDGEEEEYYRSAKGQFPVRWTSPEAMEHSKFSTHSDVWSFGVVMGEVFNDGEKPYAALDNLVVMTSVIAGRTDTRPKSCPRRVFDEVMRKCWAYDPHDRPSFAELATVLSTLQAGVFQDVGLVLEKGADVHSDYISVSTAVADDRYSAGYVVPAANSAAQSAQHEYAVNETALDSTGYIIPERSGKTVHNPLYKEEGKGEHGDF